ncbi:hypothetical protein RGQ29_023908 [Quercus rubra]|uniref:Inosine/uridine-preferring nucleoside hydrolase domain-containing protein n=1 Tax=Quercus rubra TaxID=3512 RepID=A0AAN7IUS3_QUERU|nr:hypothetical protein RGQ29_023908 [Quercus rubra]
MRMLLQGKFWVVVLIIIGVVGANLYYFLFYSSAGANLYSIEGLPYRILLDTDVDTDDLLGLLYLLKLNRSEFNVEAVTISANGWSDAGHAVNQIYDILYMMDRDDIAVGVGGNGGILEDGTILPNVGGYLPLIEQGYTTAGYCRYRQANPVGRGGRLDLDANFGIRKAFLPQGRRNYNPLWQPTAQQVMIDRISAGPITVLLIGTCTNFAIFLMSNPHLKKNIKHIYIMGGGVRTKNPTGNLFTDYTSNPYAESNMFGDPFAAYQVFHSGIPITLIPLDATNSIPISKNFFNTFEQSQNTYEAQYCFQSLKAARDASQLGDKFYTVINCPQHTGRFNFTTEFPYYKKVLYKPDFGSNKLGKPVVFDMDMSAGDFLTLFYLLKVPLEVINLKAIIVSPTGWANAATIDIIYDLLHMMGRDDIPVGLGDIFATNQSDAIFSSVGDCKYIKAIPHGSGGLIDSDTLYGLARDLPRSPRRYTQENSLKDGTPQKQPLALEVWKSVVKTLDPGSRINILTNGPLTNLAKIILSEKNTTSIYQDVYIVGGHISRGDWDKGNVFTIHSNEFAEFNMFLDPSAAKTVFDSNLNITLIPLGIQRRVGSLPRILEKLQETKRTPEAKFASRLLSMLYGLQQSHVLYRHVDKFSQEILGALVLAGDLKPTMQVKPVKVLAEGVESTDGQTMIDEKDGKLVKILEDVNYTAYYDLFANRLNDLKQSAVIGSFDEQRRLWSRQPK